MHNPAGIPRLEILQSRIPGLRKRARDYNPYIQCIYTVDQKTGATLHFPEYPENYENSLYDFLHTSRPMYTERVYNMRVYSFHYLKWFHLANRLALDNAIFKQEIP